MGFADPFRSHNIRVVTIDGEPWFVAADVCRALGMDVTRGTYKHLYGLDRDEKRGVNRTDTHDLFVGDRAPSHTLISESGRCKLVLRSDKPEAKPFQDWVTKVVLPAIRKDGAEVGGSNPI